MSFKKNCVPFSYLPDGFKFNNDVQGNDNITKEPTVNNGRFYEDVDDVKEIIEDTAESSIQEERDSSPEKVREKVEKMRIKIPKFKKKPKDPDYLKRGACVFLFLDNESGTLRCRDTNGGYHHFIPQNINLKEGGSKIPSLYTDGDDTDGDNSFVVSRSPGSPSRKERQRLNDEFYHEAKVSERLRQRGISGILPIKVRKDLTTRDPVTISPYCNKGDLEAIIKATSSVAERANFIPSMIRVAGALQKMHDAGYCHLDVKPANIFFEGMEENDVLRPVVGDLGTVTKQGVRRFCGSPEYVAPEMWGDASKKHRAKPSMDVFSFGVTLFCVLHGMDDFLFHSLEDTQGNITAIDQSRPGRVAELQLWLREQGKDDGVEPFYKIVADCIAFKPDERPTMASVLRTLGTAWQNYIAQQSIQGTL